MDPFTANNLGFQSTPPVKAATLPDATAFCTNFISIHAAREGGDTDEIKAEQREQHFNPRRP